MTREELIEQLNQLSASVDPYDYSLPSKTNINELIQYNKMIEAFELYDTSVINAFKMRLQDVVIADEMFDDVDKHFINDLIFKTT